jgi:hypothetical protein
MNDQRDRATLLIKLGDGTPIQLLMTIVKN